MTHHLITAVAKAQSVALETHTARMNDPNDTSWDTRTPAEVMARAAVKAAFLWMQDNGLLYNTRNAVNDAANDEFDTWGTTSGERIFLAGIEAMVKELKL